MVLPKGAEVTAYVSTAKELDLTRFQPGAMSLASSRGSGVRVIGDADSEKSSESGPPPGFFLHRTYTNQYFALSFPLATDWVPETGAVRNRLASRNPAQSESLLLAAVHIPQDVTDLRADSSFTVTAVTRSAHANTDNCARYLKMWPGKKATLKGTISEYTVAGHEFFRANFDSRTDASDLAVVCSPAGHYLLLWHVQGLYWDSVDDAASTVYAIVPWPPDEETGSSESFQQVTVPRNTSASLLVREVKPVYPAVAIENHIQGTVRMRAAISKDGDVEGLELLDGPVELAMSAVTAVRQWKYRPYLMGGQPVAISTEVVVNYESGPSM
jgi:protein TonB